MLTRKASSTGRHGHTTNEAWEICSSRRGRTWTSRCSHRRALAHLRCAAAWPAVTRCASHSAPLPASPSSSSLSCSLACCIAAAVMARLPRFVSGADVFFRRIGLAFVVVVGFAFAMGAHEIGAQLQQALGGQSKTGVAWVGAAVIFGFSVLGLAVDAYFSYRDCSRRLPSEEKHRFADEDYGAGVPSMQDGRRTRQ